jgi:hypothetical protein
MTGSQYIAALVNKTVGIYGPASGLALKLKRHVLRIRSACTERCSILIFAGSSLIPAG